ncbi:DUF397 domain-containing protein [Actinosynnema sp. NPDC053489]|uniref:DUF397 domain-containing protein n=1 Tax=Actinosynnema sp. NPDC053489 TaxID=3363916 RepID=UPI0037C81461
MNDRTGWFKSSRSAENPACVEVRFVPGAIDVRDSKNPTGPTLTFSRAAWAQFVSPASPASP